MRAAGWGGAGGAMQIDSIRSGQANGIGTYGCQLQPIAAALMM